MQRHNGKEIKGGIAEFKNAIKMANNFKVVIHIKQLICGIDVDCFTDCIIYDLKENNDDNQRVVIQTIGRCLRYYSNTERINAENNQENKNLKKYGKVWFIDHDEDHTEIYTFMAAQYHSNIGTSFNLSDSEHSSSYDKVDTRTDDKSKISMVNLSFKAFKQKKKEQFERWINQGIADKFANNLIVDIQTNLKQEMCYDDQIQNHKVMERLNNIMNLVGQEKVSELEKFFFHLFVDKNREYCYIYLRN